MGQKTSPLSVRDNYRYNIWGESLFSLIEEYKLREYIIYYFCKKGILVNTLTLKKEGNTVYIELDFIIARSSKVYSSRYRRIFRRKRAKKTTKRTKRGRGKVKKLKVRLPKRRLRRLKRKLRRRIKVIYRSKIIKNLLGHTASKRYLQYLRRWRTLVGRKPKKLKRIGQQGINQFLKLLCQLYKVGRVHFVAKRLERGFNLTVLTKLYKLAETMSFLQPKLDKDLHDLLLLATLLLNSGEIKAETINRVIRKYFTWLPKQKHKRFFGFIRDFFQQLYELDQTHNQVLLGIKFRISGRLQGKPRAKSFESIAGRISLQTLSVAVDYSQLTTYSRLGTFGCKLWIAKK